MVQLSVVFDVMTCVSYAVITMQVLWFANNCTILKTLAMDNRKSKRLVIVLVVSMLLLYCSFIALCGITHGFGAAASLYPDPDSIFRALHASSMGMCAIVSFATALVGFGLFPALVKIFNSLELNDEGKLKRLENYWIETIELFQTSIVVLKKSMNMTIVRGNAISTKYFGTRKGFVGTSLLDSVHPEDQQIVIDAFNSVESFSKPIAEEIPQAASVYATPPAEDDSSDDDVAPLDSRSSDIAAAIESKHGSVVFEYRVKNRFSQQSDPYVWVESTVRMVPSTISSSSSAAVPDDHGASPDEDEATFDPRGDEEEGGEGWRKISPGAGGSGAGKVEVCMEMVMITRNINDRKQAELLMKQSKEKENEAKMNYISCIAHDLKTPLQSFCFAVDLLKATPLTSSQEDIVAQAVISTDLMKLTISQTMDISKVLAGAKLVPRRATVQLSSMLKKVDVIIRGYGKQVPVTYHAADDVMDAVITDEEWLWQMLLNLLTNACKYTDEGHIKVVVSLSSAVAPVAMSSSTAGITRSSIISVNGGKRSPRASAQSREEMWNGKASEDLPPRVRSASRSSMRRSSSTLSTSSTKTMLLFEVIDTGIGVDESKAKSLFDAFSMAQSGQMQGTGLGLFGIRLRAEGLGGEVGVKRNVNAESGSVFWFTLPYVQDTAAILPPVDLSTRGSSLASSFLLLGSSFRGESSARISSNRIVNPTKLRRLASACDIAEGFTSENPVVNVPAVVKPRLAMLRNMLPRGVSPNKVVVSGGYESLEINERSQSNSQSCTHPRQSYKDLSSAAQGEEKGEGEGKGSTIIRRFSTSFDSSSAKGPHELLLADEPATAAPAAPAAATVSLPSGSYTAGDNSTGKVDDETTRLIAAGGEVGRVGEGAGKERTGIADSAGRDGSSSSGSAVAGGAGADAEGVGVAKMSRADNENAGRSSSSTAAAVASSEEREGPTAIVVDDVVMIRKFMQKVLEQAGFKRIVCCENGKRGLAAMQLEQVDVVFSDVQMPLMSGPEMVRRFRVFEAEQIKAGLRKRRQLVIAVTANGTDFDDSNDLVSPASFDLLLPKPVSIDSIQGVIDKYITRKKKG